MTDTQKAEPCGHLKAMVIQDPVVHRWCRGCGAIYRYNPKLGWHWLKPNKAHRTVLPAINHDPRIGR